MSVMTVRELKAKYSRGSRSIGATLGCGWTSSRQNSHNRAL